MFDLFMGNIESRVISGLSKFGTIYFDIDNMIDKKIDEVVIDNETGSIIRFLKSRTQSRRKNVGFGNKILVGNIRDLDE